ncbi:hypothetical protein [Deinococcus metallilatus]|uniref:Phenylacetic acid degradation b n=1 Tax=Deinococcus metallilatus TaxID=1211322 RepID=A0ABR6MN60_9DEIO|nr:hypothetical protein [Deinococcus metallilatus]MBB5293369.1 hypothetical protein [Deinococcus metallilatus]GMA15408.1 hypothetical protein GCM10025871_17390 [Deinococcus metallilatus]
MSEAVQNRQERVAPQPPTRTAEGLVFEVFARFREDEVHHIGSVVALNSDLAQMYAGELYDEWRWAEMRIIPREKLIDIIPVK